jgi:peptide-methionine (S)-S-oxide reductase
MNPSSKSTSPVAQRLASLSRRHMLALCVLVAGAAVWHAMPSFAAEAAVVIPRPTEDIAAAPDASTETAVSAGGCFWGVQGAFQHVNGVSDAVSGYAGGAANTAEYNDLGMSNTGHAEAVRITYGPKQVSYGKLPRIYFSVAHNPTELNRQGPDTGTQYRSTVFPANAEQARVAKSYIAQLDKTQVFGKRIATTIEPGKTLYIAEALH